MSTTLSPHAGSAISLPADISQKGMSMNEASLTCAPAISPDMPNAISSPASADGRSPSELPAGQTTDLFGRAPVPASPSAPPENRAAPLMQGIFGLSGWGSSASVALTQSLVNRLRQRLGSGGSTVYSQTWKMKITPAGRRYWAHTASGHRTSASDSGGLPTPSGTSQNSHVDGRLGDWGGSGNPFRGTELGGLHLPRFELWMMGYPETWAELMPPAMPSSRKSRRNL